MTTDPTEQTDLRPLRSYGRRKGKRLTARKLRLLDDLLPKLRLELSRPAPCNLGDLFSSAVEDVWLEIGFGAGEHLLWQARAHTDIGLIGCEPFLNGVASLLGRIEDHGLATVRIHDGDARDVIAWLPDAALSRIFILFPDPWPKKRQTKRRLITREFIRSLARILRPGGELRFASDDMDYVCEVLHVLSEDENFAWTARRASDWRERPKDWPPTRYEQKALSENRPPAYLRFCRL
ncbi:MAG: tRNA (guanosine(46)-N7)-methyltransferase TrmB [Pseudomonadota bacterium]